MRVTRSFANVMILSTGFMLVFAAFQTMSNIEKTVLQSIRQEEPSFTGDAYVSLAIIYAVFASCNWLAPSYISVTGPRIAIFTGACCYIAFICSFLWPHNAVLYAASCILGLGAALIWTGQGQYLTENSDSDTMSRNAGIFWAIFQTSMFAGNIFVYFMLTDAEIKPTARLTIFSVLTGLAVGGTVLLGTLTKPPQREALGEAEGVSSADRELRLPEPVKRKPLLAAWYAFTDALHLFFSKNMLMLSFTFIYTGLALTFYSGVYSSSVGFTEAMGDSRKRLVGLSGIFIGVGEVIGGALFGIFASKVSKYCGGWTVVTVGLCSHLFAYVTIFVNLPNDAPFDDTNSTGIVTASPALAMAGSFTLGFGDACYNTQIYSLLGVLYAKESAPAFALFKFCQSVAAAVSFGYSTVLGLYAQLAILLLTLLLGTASFVLVERLVAKNNSDRAPESDPTFLDAASGEE